MIVPTFIWFLLMQGIPLPLWMEKWLNYSVGV